MVNREYLVVKLKCNGGGEVRLYSQVKGSIKGGEVKGEFPF